MNYPDGDSRLQKYFKRKSGPKGADEWASSKRRELESEGAAQRAVTPEERRAVMAFREMVEALPESIARPALSDAVNLLRDTLGIRHKSKTVAKLVESYLVTLDRKQLSESYLYSTKGRLDRFAKSYGSWLACDLSAEVIAEWLEELKLSPQSVNHYRAAIIQLFNHALETGVVEKNPVASIAKKKTRTAPPGILTPHQVASLLDNAPAEILPGLALGIFAGVRRAELCRMTWNEIDFEQDHVEVTASQSKTAARRLIPLRENLAAWLAPIRRHTGPIMPSEMIWRTRLAEAMARAGIADWPHNAPRHSFASYHLARIQNAEALALEMGHGSTKMIFEHYRAVVTPKDGESYWSIAPAAEGTITHIKSA